jgi:hypothetical protein
MNFDDLIDENAPHHLILQIEGGVVASFRFAEHEYINLVEPCDDDSHVLIYTSHAIYRITLDGEMTTVSDWSNVAPVQHGVLQ